MSDRKLLTTAQAAEFLGVSQSYLNKLRLGPGGVPFVKLGARVAYDPDDLDRWIEANKRRSTSDAGAAVTL